MVVIKVGDKLGQASKVLKIIGGPGQSGMGIVYICYNTISNSITAVKTFQNHFFSSVDLVDAFKLECLAWINLGRHPFIVMAYTVENINAQPFIHLEYVAPDKFGRNTLTHYLQSPISLKKALKWGVQFCHAMEHSIARGVTPHRDIKPDNIMISYIQDVKVTDFGLAKLWNLSSFLEAYKNRSDEKINNFVLSKNTNNKNIAGTPPWMAPEQFEGIVDSKSDIYSFGIVLFQMVNHGKLPFTATSLEGYKNAHKKHPLPRFESPLFPIMKKCMEKSPEDRYLTFNDLRLALEDLYRKVTGENYKITFGSMEYDSTDYRGQGLSFLSLGLYDEAIEAFKKSITLDSNSELEDLNNLGIAYHRKGVYDKAIDAFNRAINASPEYELTYVNLVSAYMHKSYTINDLSIFSEKIKNTLDKLLELNPNNADGLHNLAIYYAEVEKDNPKAVEILKRCIELKPNNINPYVTLGRCYERLGMIDKAIVTFKKSVQLNPTYENGLYRLGRLVLTQKKYEEAYPIFHRLTRINPTESVYQELLENIQDSLLIKKGVIPKKYMEKKKKKAKKKKKNK